MSTKDTDTEQLAAGLGQLSRYMRMAEWREAEPLGLTATQSACLSLLAGRGPCRVTLLARLLGVTQATASDVVAVLERKGHVERRPDPADGRASLVHLLAGGDAVARQTARPPSALVEALEALGPTQGSDLRSALAEIIRHLQSVGAIEPQRLCLNCRFFRPYVHSDAARPHHCAFVDAAFGDASLRFDCGDHEPAEAGTAQSRQRP